MPTSIHYTLLYSAVSKLTLLIYAVDDFVLCVLLMTMMTVSGKMAIQKRKLRLLRYQISWVTERLCDRLLSTRFFSMG